MTLALVKKEFERHTDKIQAAMPVGTQSLEQAEHLIKTAHIVIGQQPTLAKCSPYSLIQAVVNAAALGLDLTLGLQHAYLVPYKDKKGNPHAHLIVGYRGYILLAKRSDEITAVNPQVVMAKDYFEPPDLANSKPPVHRPYLDGPRGDPQCVYCITHFVTGPPQIDFMSMEEVEDRRKRSRGGSVWETDYVAMVRKSVVRKASSLWTLSPKETRLIGMARHLEDRAESGDVIDVDYTTKQSSRVKELAAKMGAPEPAPLNYPDVANRAMEHEIPRDVFLSMKTMCKIDDKDEDTFTETRLEALKGLVDMFPDEPGEAWEPPK